MDTQRKPGKFRLIWGIIMVFIYLCMAYMVAFVNFFDLSQVIRFIIGFLFLAYGVFRGIRLWKEGM